MKVNRRQILAYCTMSGLGGTLFPGTLVAAMQEAQTLTVETIRHAEEMAGLSFTPEQRELMLEDVQERLETFAELRSIPLPNDVLPAIQFDLAVGGYTSPTAPVERVGPGILLPEVSRPSRAEDLAFLTVAELASLIKAGSVSCTELTELYLSRLKEYNGVLEAVVTLTEERALEQAAARDAELAAGQWRGPLHGIPWGAKDLLAVRGYPTTWGAMPYRDQVIDRDAEVVRRLDEAGAILIAKLSLGALAWGDVWYGGQTKNPWNIEQGASGSSAGSGSTVAAGLVGFAIGSETLGSIVSPATRNGVTGLRPTYGRVSRYGAMALSWTMDKLGPMCRSAADCALVFDALHGTDPKDPSTRDAPFDWTGASAIDTVRIGYLPDAFEGEYAWQQADAAALDVLRDLGVDLVPVTLPDLPVGPMLLTLNVEAAAAFDDLTRSGGSDSMVRQVSNAWPNVFRHARFVPAVEYIQANRARTLLMQAMHEALRDVDVFVTPSFRGSALRITNLTGHPCVVVPHGFLPLEDAPDSPRRQPTSISFIGDLDQDAAALRVAQAFQEATAFHRQRPPIR